MKTILFSVLTIITLYLLLINYPMLSVILQTIIISLIASIGENYASGKNFYFYNKNSTKYWVKRVPFYIIPFWVFFIQLPISILSFFITNKIILIITSSFITMLIDLIIVEPIMCKKLNLWIWIKNKKTPLSKINKFNKTPAPIGNYIIWFLFPLIANFILIIAPVA